METLLQKSKAPLVLGTISIIFAILMVAIGLFSGIVLIAFPMLIAIMMLVYGSILIDFAILIAIVGFVCGVIGLVLTLKNKKTNANLVLTLDVPKAIPYDYKLEKNLNSIGVVISIVWIVAIYLLLYL